MKKIEDITTQYNLKKFKIYRSGQMDGLITGTDKARAISQKHCPSCFKKLHITLKGDGVCKRNHNNRKAVYLTQKTIERYISMFNDCQNK